MRVLYHQSNVLYHQSTLEEQFNEQVRKPFSVEFASSSKQNAKTSELLAADIRKWIGDRRRKLESREEVCAAYPLFSAANLGSKCGHHENGCTLFNISHCQRVRTI